MHKEAVNSYVFICFPGLNSKGRSTLLLFIAVVFVETFAD